MILRRYFMREALRTVAIIVGALVVIFVSTRFAAYLGQAAEGKVAPAHILSLLILKLIVALKDLLPLALYLGVFSAVVRMQRDSEIIAIRAAGAGHHVLITGALALGVGVALITGTLTLYGEARAELAMKAIRDRTENEATIAGVKAGRFKELAGGERVFYAEGVAEGESALRNAFVQASRGPDQGPALLRSDSALVETDAKTNDRFAVFVNGTSYAGTPGQLDYVITHFDRYALRIENRLPQDVSMNTNYMMTSTLLKLPGPQFAAELHWRLAPPVVGLLLPCLAVLIALMSRGGNWYLGLITAISAYFVYNNLLGVAKVLVKKGELAAWIGLWPVHLGAVVLILGLLVWQRRPALVFRRRGGEPQRRLTRRPSLPDLRL